MTNELLEAADYLADQVENYFTDEEILSLPPTRAEFEAGPAGDREYHEAVRDHYDACDASKDAVIRALRDYRRAEMLTICRKVITATAVTAERKNFHGRTTG
jgi:hypothetical protein